MSQPKRRIYDPTTAPRWSPVREWVTLSDGSEICVWELSVAENFEVIEAAQRHPQDPRPGQNEREASLWLLAYACRQDDTPGSARIWSDMHAPRALELPPADFARLLVAARGLLAGSEEAERARQDFTPPLSEDPSPI